MLGYSWMGFSEDDVKIGGQAQFYKRIEENAFHLFARAIF